MAINETLLAKINKGKELESAERAGTTKVNYISLAKAGVKALDPTAADRYIPGLAIGDYYCANAKKNLGKDLKVIPLAFLSLFNEMTSTGTDGKLVGVWTYEDGVKNNLLPGSYYNRELPNGNVLMPVQWVLVYLPDFPEIENAVITFKATGTKVARNWKKDAQGRSELTSTLLYHLTFENVSNDKNTWLEIKPVFDGETINLETGEAAEYAEKVIDLSNNYREQFRKGALIAHHEVSALPAPASSEEDDGDLPF